MTDSIDTNLTDDGGNVDQKTAEVNTAPAWTAQLDKDLQTNERLTSFKSIGEMGKAFLESEGKLSGAVFVPGEDASDEQKAAYREKMGIPATPDKYTIAKPEGLPEGIEYSKEAEGAYKQFAHDNGLTNKQAASLHGWYHDLIKTGYAQQQQTEKQALDAAINTLKDEWKGDAFKANTELATRVFTKFGGEEAQKFIETTKVNGLPLGDHPVFLKIFANIGKVVSDDSAMGDRSTKGHEMSDEDKAKQRFPNTNFKE